MDQFAIVNFMDVSKPTPTLITAQTAGYFGQPLVWRDYKAMLVQDGDHQQSLVYKLLNEMPCADLCQTCDDIFRNKCLTFGDNASMVGGVCVCISVSYERVVSPTKKECLACSPLCEECPGGAPTQCTSFKDPLTEIKGDGSCGCIDGKHQVGSQCMDCHSSCQTCSGLGASDCLICDPNKGLYHSSSSCNPCHSSCKTYRRVGNLGWLNRAL